MIASTLSHREAAERIWDVVIVGAGPAGAMAAHELAKSSLQVLLIDQSEFPRPKVCGCCLNGAALRVLEEAGLGNLPSTLQAKPIRGMRLAAARKRASIQISSGYAVSRSAFDAALVQSAIAKGAHFLPGASASLEPDFPSGDFRCLILQGEREIFAKIILAAHGLAGKFLDGDKNFSVQIRSGSHIAAGAIAGSAPGFYEDGIIFMAASEGGYVGLVRVEDGRLNIAAALNPQYVRQSEGPKSAVKRILKEAGFPPIAVDLLAWHGKPELTRRTFPLASERLFVAGDAAGYVEPFTGEGIAWALASSMAAVPLIKRAVHHWEASLAGEWGILYEKLLGPRQSVCRVVTDMLRQDFLRRTSVKILSRVPSLAAPLMRYINSPFPVS